MLHFQVLWQSVAVYGYLLISHRVALSSSQAVSFRMPNINNRPLGCNFMFSPSQLLGKLCISLHVGREPLCYNQLRKPRKAVRAPLSCVACVFRDPAAWSWRGGKQQHCTRTKKNVSAFHEYEVTTHAMGQRRTLARQQQRKSKKRIHTTLSSNKKVEKNVRNTPVGWKV